MSTHAHLPKPRVRRTAVIAHRPSRAEHRMVVGARASLEPIDPAVAQAEAEIRRWVELLATPFVLAAVFFGAAVSTGQQWLMVPAIVLGPILMVITLVFVMLTCDTNNEGTAH